MTPPAAHTDRARDAIGAADPKSHLLGNAFALVNTMPLGELTLRPLAERASVSVATLTHHFGNKQGLLDALIGAAIAREAAFVQHWEQALRALPVAGRDVRSRMAITVFEDWIARNRAPLLVLLDLLRSPDLAQDGRDALRRWVGVAGPFWSAVLFGTNDKTDLALGYVIDEAGFALGASDHPLYRALRQRCLETLVAQTAAGQPAGDGFEQLFHGLVAALEPMAIPPGCERLGPRSRAIVEATATLLTSPVHQAITHRSVAQAAGVSAATVVYRFGSTEDLLVAGIYGVIDRFRRGCAGLGPSLPTPVADLVRATGMVALASARLPILVPHALDMRRRRGENVKADLLVQAGAPQELAADPIFRQLFAIALFGSRRLAYALGGADDGDGARAILKSLIAASLRKASA